MKHIREIETLTRIHSTQQLAHREVDSVKIAQSTRRRLLGDSPSAEEMLARHYKDGLIHQLRATSTL